LEEKYHYDRTSAARPMTQDDRSARIHTTPKRLKMACSRAKWRLPASSGAALIAFWLMHIESQRDSG
jgi:hypothetical protein